MGKHVSSLPVLEAYNPSNPTALGDWIAVVQPMLSSLSDTGSVWWGYTFQAANRAYVRWLATSPLERLSIQKEFDQVTLVQPQHALLEQRCVTLILQSIPDELRVDIVASRHLSVAGMIFRLMTVFQPGGASERATMLRFLVTPKVAATLSEAAKLLRQWAQWRMRLTQLQAAEPDTTLLVKGLDTLTQKALAKHLPACFVLLRFVSGWGLTMLRPLKLSPNSAACCRLKLSTSLTQEPMMVFRRRMLIIRDRSFRRCCLQPPRSPSKGLWCQALQELVDGRGMLLWHLVSAFPRPERGEDEGPML